MTVLRFAAVIAFSRDRRHRWRQVSIALAGAIATMVILGSIALPRAAEAAYDRGGERAPRWDPALVAEPGEPVPSEAALAIVQRASVVDGAQVPTIWIEPVNGHDDDADIVPVGLDEIPEPGTAVLSPALLRAGYTAADFGWEHSTAGSGERGGIGAQGLMSASERLIYVRPAEGRTLGSGPSVLFTSGFDDYRSAGVAFVTDPDLASPTVMAQGAVLFLVVPGLILLLSAIRARSRLRDGRLAMMVTFGVRSRTARSVLAAESGLLAGAGALVGCLAYPLVSGLLQHVPGTRLELAAGSLTAPWWAYPAVVVAIVLAAALGGALGRLEPKGARRRSRRVNFFGLIGLAISLACLMVSTSSSNPLITVLPVRDAEAALLVVGTFGAILTVPLAVPAVTAVLSNLAERSRHPTWWTAGRRLRFDAVRLSRVASTLSVLVVILSTAISLWGASAISDAEVAQEGAPATVRDVSWRGAEPGDATGAQNALDAHGTGALFLPTIEPEDEFGSPRVIVEDCENFVRSFGADSSSLCGGENAEEFESFVTSTTGMDRANGTASESGAPSGDAVVVAPEGLKVTEIQEALGFLPGLNVAVRYSDVPAPLPMRQWIMAGALATLVLLGVAVVREIGDRSLDDAARDSQYLRLGLSARAADRLAWLVLLIPLVVGVALSFMASVVIAYQGELALVMAGDPIRLAIVAGTALAIACAAVLVAGPARRASRTR